MSKPEAKTIFVNEEASNVSSYWNYHKKRFQWAIEKLHQVDAKKIVEIGSHPWVMTSCLVDDPSFEIMATVSAEEVTPWPDDIGVTKKNYHLKTFNGKEASFPNYSANIERTRFPMSEQIDTVIACEIIEHLLRSPHLMLLNFNQWLPMNGKLLMTTPNGAQFSNPFRRRPPTSALRCNVYERHVCLYTLKDLVDIVSLCGFRIIEAGYQELYERQGMSSLYGLLARLPGKYFKDKFQKTVFVIAEKDRNVEELQRCPRIYDPRGHWEFIAKENPE